MRLMIPRITDGMDSRVGVESMASSAGLRVSEASRQRELSGGSAGGKKEHE